MSNDITTSKEALSKKVQELPCKIRSMYAAVCLTLLLPFLGCCRPCFRESLMLCARNGTRLRREGFPGKQTRRQFTLQHISLAVAPGSQMWKRRKISRKGRGESNAGSVTPLGDALEL